MLRSLVAFILLSLISAGGQATTVTYSGLDLYGNPNVSFPNGTPTLIGSSLLLGPSSSGTFPKLIVVPIVAAGALSSGGEIIITANMTRVACAGACAGGPADFDPAMYVGDGARLVGFNTDDSGIFELSWASDSGDQLTSRTTTSLGGPSAMPSIGSTFTAILQLTLRPGNTLVSASPFGVTESGTSGVALDPAQALYFTLTRDNDAGERYQIDSLSITTPVVPVPAAVWLFGTALGLMGVMRRKVSV